MNRSPLGPFPTFPKEIWSVNVGGWFFLSFEFFIESCSESVIDEKSVRLGLAKVKGFWGAGIPMKFGSTAPNAARIIDAACGLPLEPRRRRRRHTWPPVCSFLVIGPHEIAAPPAEAQHEDKVEKSVPSPPEGQLLKGVIRQRNCIWTA